MLKTNERTDGTTLPLARSSFHFQRIFGRPAALLGEEEEGGLACKVGKRPDGRRDGQRTKINVARRKNAISGGVMLCVRLTYMAYIDTSILLGGLALVYGAASSAVCEEAARC